MSNVQVTPSTEADGEKAESSQTAPEVKSTSQTHSGKIILNIYNTI